MKIIKTQTQYKKALKRLEQIFDAKTNTSKGDELELLSLLIEKYENERYPISMPHPIEAIKFRMEQAGLKPKDLQPMIGGLNRVYEILNHKRPLTLRMIWKLHSMLGIPAESLIQPDEELRAA
jgi:HTH-type transcriptional regulator/antitoxin HigA